MTLIPSFIRRLTLPVLLSVLTGGCAAPQVVSYHGRSFVPVADPPVVRDKQVKPMVVVTSSIDEEAQALYENGYQLVGFSKFVSPLAPMLASTNARATARAQGADYVLTNKPQSAGMGQHFFLATYWLSPRPDAFIFGAYYDNPPDPLLAMIGCQANFIAITGVVPGSPAEVGGLRTGDVVLTVSDLAVSSAAQLDTLIVNNAGKSVDVRIVRNGNPITLQVQLNADHPRRSSRSDPAKQITGIDFERVKFDKVDRKRYKRKKGLFVNGITPGSAACTADLRSGDLVIKAAGKTFKSPDQLRALTRRGRTFQLEVIRQQQPLSVRIDPTVQPAPRLRIAEASHGFPWQESTGKDWSAMVAAIQAGQAALGAMQSYTSTIAEQGEAQKAEHFRVAQQMAASRPRVEQRRGRYFARTDRGHYVQISSATAAKLGQRPDALVEEGRGGRGYLTDSMGNRILVQEPQPQFGTLARVRPVASDQDAAFSEGLREGAIVHAETMSQLNRWWADKIHDFAWAGSSSGARRGGSNVRFRP